MGNGSTDHKSKEETTRKFQKGELRYSEGIPFLKVAGSHYEMGYQYGVLLKEELQTVFKKVIRLKNSFFSTIPGFFIPLVNILFKIRLWVISLRLPKGYRAEMRGIAKGAGLQYIDVLYMGLILEITTSSLPDVANLLEETDCSSVLLKKENRIIHGRNFDFLPLFLGNFTIIVEYNPEGKNSYTSIGIIGYPGVFTGVNEHGLSTVLNISVGYKRRFIEIPISYKLRELLSNCSTIKEVDEELEGFKVEVGMILSVGSAIETEGVIYDLTVNGMKKNKMEDSDHIFVCNRYLDKELTKKETPISFGLSYLNLAREDKIREYLVGQKVKDIDSFINLLADTGYYRYQNIWGTHNGTVNNERTLHSVILDLKNSEIYFAAAPGFAGWAKYLRYNLKNGEVVLYKEPNNLINDTELKKYLQWYDDILILFVKNDYQSIISKVMEFKILNRAQLIFLDTGWEKIKNMIDKHKFFTLMDESINKYPDFAFLYKYKGKFLLSLNQIEEAIVSLEKGLKAGMIFVSEILEIYQLLARAYHRIGNMVKGREYATKCLEIISEYSKKFALGKIEKHIKREMLSYRK